MKSTRRSIRRALPRRNALVVALAVGMGISGLAYGQATSGDIFGTAPAGDTVQVVSNTGATRTVTVGADGTYTVSHLPLGTYTVTLQKDGQTVATRNNVDIQVGGGVAVSFANQQAAQSLGAVEVTANALPAIDVTQVHDTQTITAADLAKLPIGRNAESIALLSPGTVLGSTFFNRGINFGGSSVSENAYYVNGYNTGEPYRNIGGFQLPYGAIAQQQTLSGGFSAKYGRADGGVISQTGKRGTNQWHFGGQIVWRPRSLEASPKSLYYPEQKLPSGDFGPVLDKDGNPIPGSSVFSHAPNYTPGALRRYRGDNKEWDTTYTAYVGGPLIKDKLFVFLDVEQTKGQQTNVASVTNPQVQYESNHETKFYGKLDWNINDSNIFEATFLQDNSKDGQGATYYYDNDNFVAQGFKVPNDQRVNDARFLIAHYTSYITENATLSVLYGKGEFSNPVYYGVPTSTPFIGNGSSQDPQYWGPGVDPNVGIITPQSNTTVLSPMSHLSTHGLRADFTYVLGNHTLGVGIDNMRYNAQYQGGISTGGNAPADVVPTNNAPVDGSQWIYHVQGSQYYVQWRNIASIGGMSVRQNAYYLQDKWQVTPDVLLNLGLRNDHFTNYNNLGQAFVDEKNQWEPRLGVSWDVFGDSSLKIYGNAGRYYLALPTNAANRAAVNSTFVRQNFTYGGIDPNTGVPLDLTPLNGFNSPDGEFGGPKDPKQVVSQNLKPMYIDQFNVGFDARLGQQWTYGAKLSYRELKASIDDECMPGAVFNKMKDMGLIPQSAQMSDSKAANFYGNGGTYYNSLFVAGACRLINPGRTSQFLVQNSDDGSYVTVPMSFEDWGYPRKPTRKYASLNLYFAHPFDGKWFGRVDYTFTHARGNTTGQVRPDFGQADVSKTEDWDSGPLMEGSYGELLSTREQVLRFRGSYQITPEWLVSATARIQSGAPQECLGYTGTDALGDPTGYNGGGSGNYHWCAGQIVHPGSDGPYAGHTPWLHMLNLGVRYAPAFADHKLAFKLFVFNVLNEQNTLQTSASLVASPHTVSNTFHTPVSNVTTSAVAMEPPRYIRLSVSYDY